MSTSDHPNDGFVTRPNETMEGDEASTSTAPDAAPVPAAAAPAPTKGGRGGRGGARKAGSTAGRGKKRNSELDGLRDSLNAEPSTSKRPRRGAAPAVLETSTSTSTTTAAIEAAVDAEQPGLGNETSATVTVTAGPSKKRVIQTSSEDEDGAPQEGAGRTSFRIKLKKPSVEEPRPSEPSAVADQAAEPAAGQSAIQDVDEGATSSVVAPQPVQEDDTQPLQVPQEAPVEPTMQEPSPPSTLATPVIEVAEDSDTDSTSAATNNRKKVSNKPGMAGKARGGPTPSISQQTLPPGSSPMPGSSGLTKKPKQPIKPPGSLKPKAKPAPAAAAAAPAASANIFDSLFSGIVATTDHEKQLKKDRDERAVAVAKQKEREAQAKKATLSLARVAAAGGTDSGNEGSDSQSVKKQKQPTKAALPSFGKQPGSKITSGFQDISRLQQRYGGQEHSRKQEIAAARAEAKRKREEAAQAGGFDLLAQGLEMSAFETPFLKDWNSHQSLVFGGQGRIFPFYKGGPPKDDMADDEEEGQMSSYKPTSLQHPWTFGAAFAFKGSKPAYTPTQPVWI